MDFKKERNQKQTARGASFLFLFALAALTLAGAARAATSSASFAGSDTSSQGNWKGKYGADGECIASNSRVIPSYASFNLYNQSNWVWADNTTDVRALQTTWGRTASAWLSSAFTMDINFMDGNLHQFALYAVDWDSKRRFETIEILDANSGSVLDTRSISGFMNGIYLTWNLRGHVKVIAISKGGFSAVVSGVFFGSAKSSATAPAITTQPASNTVNAGQTATFSVAASGTSPFTYQWKKSGSAISGATSSSYTTPATTTSDNGSQFSVSVTNSAGTANSNAAVLTVTSASSILKASPASLSFGSVNVSSTRSATVALTNAGTAAITIAGLSVSGAGFNASGISSGTTLRAGLTATVTVTFTPAASGSVSGSLTVATNVTGGATVIPLSGTGTNSTSHSVTLSWAPSASQVIGYNVYVSTVSGGSYTKLTASPVDALSYTDGGLQTAQTRYYVVTSVNSENQESAYSSQVTAVVP